MKKIFILIIAFSTLSFSSQTIFDYAKIVDFNKKEKEQFLKYNLKDFPDTCIGWSEIS